MKITRINIKNFRCIRELDLDFGDTTVLIGPNSAGKSAIVDAIRIVLTRRWGQRGTGFTELDVHRPEEGGDPKTLPPVAIEITIEEPEAGSWDADMVAALDDIMTLQDAKNIVRLRVTCAWSEEKETFDPLWEFLTPDGDPMTGKAQRATNLTGFFSYMPVFWLGALRDAADEFHSRGSWGRLLKGVRIPKELEIEVLKTLAELDAKVIAADPKLTKIAKDVGQSTHIAIGEGPGGARLNMLPIAIEDMLARSGVLIQNELLRPWLPLDHQGQGLQSLAVIFLFQAAVTQQLLDADPGMEAIFAIEEPEVHLHPQAARALWQRVSTLTGQRIMTTHSPYFVQHVPLRDLRIVGLRGGRSEVAFIPPRVISSVSWNEAMEKFVTSAGLQGTFEKDLKTGRVAAKSWFDAKLAEKIASCFKDDADAAQKKAAINSLRHTCRTLPSEEDEIELGFHGRRVRGEIFFARRWLLVEGVCEHLLVHAIARALDWPLDDHGVTVIDFQQSGNAGVYPALADAFGIPWDMVVDGDGESEKFRQQIFDRGYTEDDIKDRFTTHPNPQDLEDCLVALGHEPLLRNILAETSGNVVLTCPPAEFIARLKNKKTGYMSKLAPMVAADPALATKMPKAFIDLINRYKAAKP
jgi:putative ATP-dependent endonuclease of OLD family